MITKKQTAIVLAVFIFWIALSAIFKLPYFAQIASKISLFQKDINVCYVCGREIHENMGVILNTEKNGKIEACCPECATHYEDEKGDKVLGMTVTDYYSGRKIDSEDAFYVVGGNLSPCCKVDIKRSQSGETFQISYDRCLPTVFSFENRSNALKYQKEHGGNIATTDMLPKKEMRK